MKLNTFNVIEGDQRAHAERFLEILTGSKDTPMHFTVQTAGGWAERYGALAENWDWLTAQNIHENANIFVTVHETDGSGSRQKGNITHGRAVIAESDRGPMEDVPYYPTVVVNSKAGPHLWGIRRPDAPAWDADAATRKTRDVVYQAGTDPAIATRSRIMRMPGFLHMKDPSNPHLVTLSLPADGAVRYYDRLDEVAVPRVDDHAWQAYQQHYVATGLMAKVHGSEPLPPHKDVPGWISNAALQAVAAAWVAWVRFIFCRRADLHDMIGGGSLSTAQVEQLLRLHSALEPVPFASSVSADEWRDRHLWAKFSWESQQFPPAAGVTAHNQGGRDAVEWTDNKEKAKVWLSGIAAFRRQVRRAQKDGTPPPPTPAGFDPDTISLDVVRALGEQLRRAAGRVPGIRRNARFDLVRFLNEHDLLLSDAVGDQIRAKCPFGEENHPHDPTGAVFNPIGRRRTIGFHCFHASCAGLKWSDVVEHFGANVISEYLSGPPTDDSSQCAAGAGHELARLEDQIPGTPWPDLVVPKPWRLRTDGVFHVDRDGQETRVTHAPVVIAGFARPNDHRQQELVTLAWLRADEWVERVVPRIAIADTRTLGGLADFGCPVHSGNDKRLVNYFADFEAANLNVAKTELVTRHLGWQPDGEFVIGNRVILPDGEVVESGTDGALRFVADEAAGDLQLSLAPGGSLDGWLNAVQLAAAFPPAMVAIYAALAPVLLKVVSAMNFAIEWAGATSLGKTTCLRLAASVWGSVEMRFGATLLRSWDNTPVALERVCAAQPDLPLLLDDTQRWPRRPEELSKAVYQIANGVGRGRGDKVGTRETTRWRTGLLSTGERTLASFAPGSGGDKARVMSLWGSPFPGDAAAARAAVTLIIRILQDNFGWAGPRFVSFIQLHQDEWPAWQDEYRAIAGRLGDSANGNPVGIRLAEGFAVVRLAARLAHACLDLPGDWEAACDSTWRQILGEVPNSDPAKEAFDLAYHYCVANPTEFYGGDPPVDVPSKGYAGRVERDGSVSFIGAKLKDLLERWGHEAKSTIKIWIDRGWVDGGSDGRGTSTRFGLFAKPARCYTLRRSAVEEQVVDCPPADDQASGKTLPFLAVVRTGVGAAIGPAGGQVEEALRPTAGGESSVGGDKADQQPMATPMDGAGDQAATRPKLKMRTHKVGELPPPIIRTKKQ